MKGNESTAGTTTVAPSLEQLPKLPSNLRHEIHAIAKEVHKDAVEAEETEYVLFCSSRTLEYVAGVGSQLLNYFAMKMEQLDQQSAAAICGLLSTTLENDKEKAEHAAELEAEGAAVSAAVAEVAQKIEDATDDKPKDPSAANAQPPSETTTDNGKKQKKKRGQKLIT